MLMATRILHIQTNQIHHHPISEGVVTASLVLTGRHSNTLIRFQNCGEASLSLSLSPLPSSPHDLQLRKQRN